MQNKYVISKVLKWFTKKFNRLVAVVAKLDRYDNRREQCRHNHLFQTQQKRLSNKLEETQREKVIPDAEEGRYFWSDI